MVDTDHSGEISKSELFNDDCAVDDNNTLVSMWKHLDRSGDGLISLDEWLEYWGEMEDQQSAMAAEAKLRTLRQHFKLAKVGTVKSSGEDAAADGC